MVISPDVKSGVQQYTFLNTAFDNSQEVQTKTDYYYNHDLGSGSITYWFAKTSLCTKVGNCYSVFENFPSGVQRDYIYYNMTPTDSTGLLDNHMMESIYKFRVVYNPNSSDMFFENGDLSFANHLYQGSSAPELTTQELQALNWGEGALEFMFKINAGFPSEIIKYVSCTLNQAFKVKRVRERRRFFLGVLQSRLYFIEDRTCLDSKWIDANLSLFTWDIASVPDCYTIHVFEHDNGTSTTTGITTSWSYMTNFTRQMDVGGSIIDLITMKTSLGQSQNFTISQNKSTSITTVDGDDSLGSLLVQYINPVVLENATSGVRLNFYNTGKVELLIVPVLIN